MKSQNRILIAFVLNLVFSIIEFSGGVLTGSVAIVSDAVHDMGDAVSIGLAYILEIKSTKKADENFTYGYVRYSVIGGALSAVILILGSLFIIYNALCRFSNPVQIHYNGMIVFALIGFVINSAAAFFTHGGKSINQKAINLHMLEDVLGWCIVLTGAFVMRFTNLTFLDPLMSIGVAIFILINAGVTFKKALDLFLEKTPEGINISDLKEHILNIDGISDVHHIHVWSLDGYKNYATIHIVTDCDYHIAKGKIREELRKCGISHVTIETEYPGEKCEDILCDATMSCICHHGHIHHH